MKKKIMDNKSIHCSSVFDTVAPRTVIMTLNQSFLLGVKHLKRSNFQAWYTVYETPWLSQLGVQTVQD